MRRVHHLGVELNAEEPPLGVLERSDRRVLRRRDDRGAGRWLDDRVAVRHPDRLLGGQRCEQLAAARRVELGPAELGDLGAVDAAAELEREQLGPVTDAERRDAELEERRIEARRSVGVDRRGAAGEDQRAGIAALQLLDRRVVRDELGVDARFTHASCDQLRVLAAEIDHQHGALFQLLAGSEDGQLSRVGNWVRPW